MENLHFHEMNSVEMTEQELAYVNGGIWLEPVGLAIAVFVDDFFTLMKNGPVGNV